jgi:hypothetical protein
MEHTSRLVINVKPVDPKKLVTDPNRRAENIFIRDTHRRICVTNINNALNDPAIAVETNQRTECGLFIDGPENVLTQIREKLVAIACIANMEVQQKSPDAGAVVQGNVA